MNKSKYKTDNIIFYGVLEFAIFLKYFQDHILKKKGKKIKTSGTI